MKIIFSDFDGTLTNNGKLGAVFFELLSLIEENKSELIVVSGRSLSWGHFLLTHFPLRYALMEGGGVLVYKTQDGLLKEEYLVTESEKERLTELTAKIKKDLPKTVFSLDTQGRVTDRAVEFFEMGKSDVENLENYLLKEDANFSRSNVHINFWYGNHNKFTSVEWFLKNHKPHITLDETIFYGDSLNDEAMFEKMPNSVGVSNIISVLDELNHKPKIILEGRDNAGAFGVIHHLKELFDQSEDF